MPHPVARGLATTFLAGHWSAGEMLRRAAKSFGNAGRRKWMRELVHLTVAAFGEQSPPPRWAALVRFIEETPVFVRRAAIGFEEDESEFNTLSLPGPEMAPFLQIPGANRIPSLVTGGQLAAWLGLEPGELEWFADCQGRESHKMEERLRHYRYGWIRKSSGRARLLEAPKPRLKVIQRQILDNILAWIPPHDAAHAFRRGGSTVSFVQPHVGQRVVLRIDLRDFFPSMRSSRVSAMFHSLGYPDAVARSLTGLCTNTVPDSVLREGACCPEYEARRRLFGVPHLPQGAPTSPALANLCAHRLDCRLAGLARKAGAVYTRYADDLLFSGDGDFERSLPRFRVFVLAILLDEGFSIRHRKTRVMRSGTRQSAAGVLINKRTNIAREDYDRLKAILHNCEKLGPDSQNRDHHPHFRAHLSGRIAYVRMVNHERGEKLQRLFDRIAWGD